jgi:hypothetical protein
MTVHSFQVTLTGVNFSDDAGSDDLDRILAACDDVVLSHEAAGDLATFDRDAPNFAAAVGSALADLERAVPAGRVLRVEAVPPAGQPAVAAAS